MERTKLKESKPIRLTLKLVLAIMFMVSLMPIAQSQDVTVGIVKRGDGHREVDFDDSTIKDENKERGVTVPVVGKIVTISAIGNDEGSRWDITDGGIGASFVTFTGIQKSDREAKKYTPYFSGTAIEDGNGIGIKPLAPYPWDVTAEYNIISIVGDTNRDGKVEKDDEKDKTTWTKEHGAIIYYGQGKKKGDKYNLDDPNIATFIIRKWVRFHFEWVPILC